MVTLTNPAPDSHRFVTAALSGASAAVNIYRHYENGSVLIFDEVERSSLADFTEKKLLKINDDCCAAIFLDSRTLFH